MLATDCVNRFGRSCSSSAAVRPAWRASTYVRSASSRPLISASITRVPIVIRMSVTALFSGSGKL